VYLVGCSFIDGPAVQRATGRGAERAGYQPSGRISGGTAGVRRRVGTGARAEQDC